MFEFVLCFSHNHWYLKFNDRSFLKFSLAFIGGEIFQWYLWHQTSCSGNFSAVLWCMCAWMCFVNMLDIWVYNYVNMWWCLVLYHMLNMSVWQCSIGRNKLMKIPFCENFPFKLKTKKRKMLFYMYLWCAWCVMPIYQFTFLVILFMSHVCRNWC